VEREGRMARENDVHLLVAERLLGVLLHDVVSVIRGDIGIDSEGADVERSPHRRQSNVPPTTGIGSISSSRTLRQPCATDATLLTPFFPARKKRPRRMAEAPWSHSLCACRVGGGLAS